MTVAAAACGVATADADASPSATAAASPAATAAPTPALTSTAATRNTALPLVAAVEMGYGHLRAAAALADELATTVTRIDRAPWALPAEQLLWRASRTAYEAISRGSQRESLAGRPFAAALDWLTAIPARPEAGNPDLFAQGIGRLIDHGLGRELVRQLAGTGVPVVSTFFTPAISAAQHGHPQTFCVVTDTEVSRAWVAREPASSGLHYFAPSRRGLDRLRAYGVPAQRSDLTGFPLPPTLLGGEGLTVARRNLARRLAHLDPAGRFRRDKASELARELGPLDGEAAPPHLAFAVGGAGAQAALVDELLPAVRHLLLAGTLRLTLIAGVRAEVAARFRRALARHQIPEVHHVAAGGGLEAPAGGAAILAAADLDRYFSTFAALLATTDLLWTKPSELTFFAALGLPILIAPPVGAHEILNRRALLDVGAGLSPPPLADLAPWLARTLGNGTLAAAAWAGFERLPRRGLYRIRDRVLAASA